VPLALAETGRLAYESGDLAAARAALERLLADFRDAPQRVSALYYLGWIARGQDKADEAGRYFDELVKQYPKDPLASDAALQRGLAWLAVERYEEAAAAFDDLLKRFSDHARADLALFSKGVALARQQQWQPAAGAFRQYLERHPKGDLADRALYELAWCEKGQQRPNDAAARYEALLANHPDSSLALKARAELAELRFDAKDFERTIAELKQALEQTKDAALREETLYRLVSAQFSKGDFAACAGTFEQFAAEFPKSSLAPSAQFQAGESRMKLGDLQAARDRFAAAVQAAESMPDTGSARKPKPPAKRGEKPRAEKAVSDTKVHEAALLRLAEVQGLLEAWKESADTAAQFQRTYPQSPYARLAAFSRGWALENLGQYESAIEAFRSVVQRNERDDTSARCQFHLGECLYGLKRHDEALMELVKVEAVYRNEAWTPKALLEMGRVLEAKGEKDKAQDQFKALIRRYPKHEAAAIAKERLDAVRKSL
jgi:TolA-binding protein